MGTSLGAQPSDTADASQTEPQSYGEQLSAHYNSLALGANLAAQDDGHQSMFDGISDFTTKGLPLIGAAAFNSFYNTAADISNFFGSDMQRASIEQQFGPNSDTTEFYNKHTLPIEAAGFIAGSLLPGLGASKVLKLAQAGEIGETLQLTTGIFSRAKDAALKATEADMLANSTGTSLFGLTRVSTVKAVLAGIGDQALHGAAYEIATLATMHANPITDSNTFTDDIADVLSSMEGFAKFGAVFEGAGAYFKIRAGLRGADISTKDQEAIQTLGKGDITPGDRIVKLYEGRENLPEPVNALGKAKNNITTQTTSTLIQDRLIEAAGGDTELAGAVRNFVEEGLQQGKLDNKQLQNNFAQLTSLGRHGDPAVVSTPQNSFFIPSKIDPKNILTTDFNTMVEKIADKDLNTHRSVPLTLTSSNILPTIGHALETTSLPAFKPNMPDIKFPTYSNAEDAFNKGADIYIDTKGNISVNAKSTVFKEVPRQGESRILTAQERAVYNKTGNLPKDSESLFSVGSMVNLTTGAITDTSALPVVGDIAKPSIYSKGLKVGDQLFPNSPAEDFSKITNPLEANARYTWAALRGIKNGDLIHPTDLPMLEQLYKEQAAGITKTDVAFTDGTKIPSNAKDTLQQIADIKMQSHVDFLAEGKNADEISHLLNTPSKGVAFDYANLNPDTIIRPVAENLNIQHVRLGYDISNTRDLEGNFLRGIQASNYRVQLAADTNTNTVSNWLSSAAPKGKGEDYLRALQFTKGAGDADIVGAGNGFLSNANSGYNTLGQQAERMGRTVTELSTFAKSKISDSLAKATAALKQDPQAALEYGTFDAVIKSTGEQYILLPKDAAEGLGLASNTAILKGAIKRKLDGSYTFDDTYIPKGFLPASADASQKGLRVSYTLSDKVTELERANMGLIADRQASRADWWKSQGLAKPEYDPLTIYHPPIDTVKNPYFAYVRQREGYALGESGAQMITAKSAEELQQKIGLLGPEFDAFTDKNISGYFKAKGEFEYNRSFSDSKVNSEMARKGILNNVVPETRAENIVNSLVDWHFRQSDLLVRDHVELLNAASFDQLSAMGRRFEDTNLSRFGFVNPLLKRGEVNPYQSYIRTALDVPNTYPLAQLAQEKLEAFADTAFNAAKSAFGAMRKGLLTPEEAAAVSERMGLGNPYGTTLEEMSKNYYGGLANQLPSRNILSKFIGSANTILGAAHIRLDTFQQLIHAVTLPIMAAMEHSAATKEMQELLTSIVPGTQQAIPSFSRTLFNAVKNYFGPDSEKLKEMYSSAAGLTRDELTTHRQMIDALTLPRGPLNDAGWTQKIDTATQAAEKLSGSKFTNAFIHFIASDVGRQIGEAAGQSGRDLLDTTGTFAGRVLGNAAAGQRAAIFQGPVGQAIGLFQSYQWNLMQQLLRHVGEGNTKSLAMGMGLQSSIFGISSLPGFSAMNSIIAGRHGNAEGQDLHSGATELLGKPTADYLLYGSLSGLTGLSLYTRGDLNPRQATILPLNPMNFVSVGTGIKVYQNLAQLASNISSKAGNVPASLLLAAEHNGLSRPLTGLAQMIQGFSTTSNGNLISSVAGFGDLANISNMSRILGAKPLEEATAMEALYNINAMKVKDMARLKELGEQVKTSLYGGNTLPADKIDGVLSEYTRAGGNISNFNQWMLGQLKDATIPEANRAMQRFNNPSHKTLFTLMGGIGLSAPSTLAPAPSTAEASTATNNPASTSDASIPSRMQRATNPTSTNALPGLQP